MKESKTPDQVLRNRLADEPSSKDVGNPNQRVSVNDGKVEVKQLPDMLADVAAFHKKFGIQYEGPPRFLPKAIYDLRVKRKNEETKEYVDAHNANQLDMTLDALVDSIYIDLGTAHLHGFDKFYEAWTRVHAANMAKERANPNNPGKYKDSQDIVKPVGWVTPDLKDLV